MMELTHFGNEWSRQKAQLAEKQREDVCFLAAIFVSVRIQLNFLQHLNFLPRNFPLCNIKYLGLEKEVYLGGLPFLI